MTVFVDTNVLVYAGGLGDRTAACQRLLRAIARGDVSATTSTLVLEELWHIEHRSGTRLPDGWTTDMFETFPEVLKVGERELQSAFTLGPPGRLGTADLIHAACCRSNRIETIVSADTGFDELGWLRRVDATEAAISALLAEAD